MTDPQRHKSSDILRDARRRLVKYGWLPRGGFAGDLQAKCVGCHVSDALADAGLARPRWCTVGDFNDGKIRSKRHALRWIDKAIELAEAAND